MPPFLTNRNKKLRIKLTPLVENADEASVMSEDAAAASSTIKVLNINKFAVNRILLIGELGGEQSEIIKTHASSAPSGTTVTLASNTVFAHKAGTPVYIIQFDQVELSRSATAGGSKTTLTTTLGSGLVALEADDEEMVYDETEYTSGYYFARFKNSIAGTFGGYCDAVPYGSPDENSVAAVIAYALHNAQVYNFNDKITPSWCYGELTDMLRFLQGKQKRYPKYQNYNAVIGATVRGTRVVAMPTDIYDPDSTKSLIGVRVGTDENLIYKDPSEYEDYIEDLIETEVATQQTAGGTSLVLDDTDDMPDSGSITVFISGTRYEITYTGITRGSHTLTGIPASGTGAITVTIPVDTKVFQNYAEGKPLVYTVRNQQIEFYPLCSDLYDNKNIYADYWTEAAAVDSDSDTLDLERFDMAKYWLTWKMRMQDKNNGKLDYKDGDYQMFNDRLKDAIVFKGQTSKHKMKPRVNGISYRRSGWIRRQRYGQ